MQLARTTRIPEISWPRESVSLSAPPKSRASSALGAAEPEILPVRWLESEPRRHRPCRLGSIPEGSRTLRDH